MASLCLLGCLFFAGENDRDRYGPPTTFADNSCQIIASTGGGNAQHLYCLTYQFVASFGDKCFCWARTSFIRCFLQGRHLICFLCGLFKFQFILVMTLRKAYFGMQCFWGESAFCKIEGVLKSRVGYAGGKALNPTYQAIKDHTGLLNIGFIDQDFRGHRTGI